MLTDRGIFFLSRCFFLSVVGAGGGGACLGSVVSVAMAGPVALSAEMGMENDGAVPRCEVPIRKGGFLWFYGTHACHYVS